MSFCDTCLLKDGLCNHLKEIMKNAMRNTGIDGSQLCPLCVASIHTPATKKGKMLEEAKERATRS